MSSGNQTWNAAQENITKAQHRVEEFTKTGADHDATVAGNRVAETRQHIENKAKEGQQAGTTFIEKIVGTGHTDTTPHSTATTGNTASTGPTTAEKIKQATNTVIDKVFGTTGNTATTTGTTHSSV